MKQTKKQEIKTLNHSLKAKSIGEKVIVTNARGIPVIVSNYAHTSKRHVDSHATANFVAKGINKYGLLDTHVKQINMASEKYEHVTCV